MKTTFHILDAISRDQICTVTRETEDEQEVDIEFEEEEEVGRSESNNTGKSERGIVIHLFGMTAEGESLRCDVEGFRPYFYVKVPPTTKPEAFAFNVRCQTKKTIRVYNKELRETESVEVDTIGSLQAELIKRKELFGFTAGEESSFLKLSVGSLAEFRALKNVFLNNYQEPIYQINSKTPPIQVYESGLDPILRFFHLRDVKPCGWVSVKGTQSEDKESGIRVITCNWTDISPEHSPPKPTAPFKTLFWDIECYSLTGAFPVANPKAGKGDPIIQIGCIMKDSEGSIDRTIFVFGDCKDKKNVCDKIDGITVFSYTNEAAMLDGWLNWLVETNPDVWVGYNIFGFDERYVWDRLTALKLLYSACPTYDRVQRLSRLFKHGGEVKLNEKRLASSAMGDNFLYTLSLQGRLQIDLFHVVKRGYALPSYSLDNVIKHFMSGKLKKITKEEDGTWKVQTSATGNAKVGRAIVLMDETGDELTDKLPILEVGQGFLRVQPSEVDVELDTDLAVKWVIVKDDVSPADIFRLHQGSSADRAIIASYCIQDCELTMELYNKLETFNNAMSMANVCSVPVTMIFTRGQGVKIESLIFKACHYAGLNILTLTSPPFNAPDSPRVDMNGNEVIEEAQDSYEGAIVLDPTPGFYTRSPVGVCDFASLYPSTIESENISYDSLLWVKDYSLDGKEIKTAWTFDEAKIDYYQRKGEAMGCRWIDISFDIWKPDPEDTRKQPKKIKTGIRVCRYAQYADGTKSALPNIVHNLLAARAAKRAEIKKETDPFRKALLDAEQLAYKLTANSLYGQLGSGVFKVRLQHLAASVTAYGRKQILFAKAAIEHFYGPEAKDPRCSAHVVYGDTDSLFVEINPRNPETGERLEGREAIQATIDITTEAGHFITQALKKPHDFEFDKAFYPFIIFSKKRYVGNMYEENADDYVQKSMGIATKRRDYAPIVKTIYGGAIKILLTNRDVPAAATFVKKWVTDMMDNKVSLNQLTITKSLRSEYKTPTPPAHKALAMRITERDPGNAPASGDRLSFVYFKQPAGFKGNQGDRVETPSFMKANNLKPDPEFYIDHQIKNPVCQLFSILIDKLPDARPPPQGWAADPDMQVAERELYAQDYLFKSATMKKTGTLTSMWGIKMDMSKAPVAQSIAVRRSPRTAALGSNSGQSRMDAFMEDRMMVEQIKKDKSKRTKK
jgi:DNA polymerase elongation subunit (family B)